MGFGTVVYTTTLSALKTSATLHLPDSFVIKYLSLNRCLNLKNTGFPLPYPCACTTFAYTVAGEHAFTRPNSPDRQNATFHLLTPIPRIFRRSTLPPAARIATYETDRIQ